MGAGLAREREQSSRQDSRDLYCSGGRSSVSETRCNGGAFRDRSSPASGSGHPSQMGGVRRRAKQCFATRLPHPWPLLVWPSLAKQLPPGTTIAPLTLQRNRHGSVPPFQRGARTFQFPKERRDRVGPSRTVFGQGWPNVEPTWMYSWRVLDGPTRSRCGLSGEKGLWDPAGASPLSRAPRPNRATEP